MSRGLGQFYSLFIVANIWLVGAVTFFDKIMAALYFIMALFALLDDIREPRK